MDTIQVPVTDSLKGFLVAQAARQGFPSPADYIQSVLADLEQREQARKELEEKLLEGVRSPKVPGDAAFWRERKQKIFDRHPELKPCDEQTTHD